jgi:hypothetical protein
MYLWKYWRESRLVFGISMGCVAVLAYLVFKGVWHIQHDPPRHFSELGPQQLAQFGFVIAYAQAPVFAFLAWLMGSHGVGRDLGEGSGSFLFTRPERRSGFLWRDWCFGLAFLLPAMVMANLLIGYMIHRLMLASVSLSGGHAMLSDGSSIALIGLMGRDLIAVMLFTGLIFGVTYFSTIVVKHARGVMLGAGILVGYLALGAIVHHYWPDVTLPSLVMLHFGTSEIAARAAVMLLFPLAAQQILERSEL